ncbi:MAG: LysE family translocator [Leptospiraceae bacterium]|nr:LysE family translocator [Leptospiraceae bacterium]MDW7975310.1 LysE family translocator [Leptospiraceae bacterium]
MWELFLIGFLGVYLPGPDMLLVIRTSLFYGRKEALIVLMGILSGNVIYLMPVILGYAIVVQEGIGFLFVFGGIFLIWMSFKIRKITEIDFSITKDTPKNFYFLGLFTNLSNPKAVLYFSSVLLPSLLKNPKEQLFSILSFFVGVVLAFLSLILFHHWVKEFIKKYLKILNFVFFLLFFSYGMYFLVYGLYLISNHIFRI